MKIKVGKVKAAEAEGRRGKEARRERTKERRGKEEEKT